ncbi:MAG: M23 family metallopeptidase [Candidatus Andersenbacteria bacterium]|nr:M23 family metallopeptidase [Candidatus Andersenbacteria bacterium]MBI3250900.1 M23 family metallopeptidase [Candidatus Andersenbacteria bacterium]
MKTAVAIIGIGILLVGALVLLSQTMEGSFLRIAAYDPLPGSKERPQLLTFGMYVTPDPAQNPIAPPERFIGFHTALDLEIHQNEVDDDIPVMAVCAGEVIQSGLVSGYGGLVVQRCNLQGEDVTVIYGHLDLDSLASSGATVTSGEKIGILAPANSEESGHTRKHLHLGIHKGHDIDVRGYVQTKEELENFLDPKEVLDL